MGTNFYKKIISKGCTKNKRRTEEFVHICKRSGGWYILFDHNWGKYYYPNRKSLEEFLKSDDGIVEDEYGQKYSEKEFWEIIDDWNKAPNLWTSESYEEYEKKRNPERCDAFDYFSEEKEKCKTLFNLPETPKYYDFELDGLRFSTGSDFC